MKECITISRMEYENLLAEIDKWKGIAKSIPVPIIYPLENYQLLIGNTNLLVQNMLQELEVRIKKLEDKRNER